MGYLGAIRNNLARYRHSRKLATLTRGPLPRPSGPLGRSGRARVAVVGAGAQGRDQCLGLQTLSNLEIVALADSRPEALEAVRQKLGRPDLHGYASAAELLGSEKLDLLCIATNTVSHLEIAELAVAAGVPRLVVEKPIGNCVARARRFADQCRKHGIKVAVNHNRRWYADYAGIRRCVEHGLIGKLREIHAVPGPGGLAMIGSHYLDLIAYLGDSSISWVAGFLKPEEKANRRGAQFSDPSGRCMLALANGVRGYLDVWDDLGSWDGQVVLRGEDGRIEVDEKAREWHLVSRSFGRSTLPFHESTRISDCFAKVAAQLYSDRPPACGLTEGIQALEAVMAIHVSHRQNGQMVALPLEGEAVEREMPFP